MKKSDTAPNPSLLKEGNDVGFNPKYKTQDSEMIAGNHFIRQKGRVKLVYFNSTEVKLYDETLDHTYEEERGYFQKWYSPEAINN